MGGSSGYRCRPHKIFVIKEIQLSQYFAVSGAGKTHRRFTKHQFAYIVLIEREMERFLQRFLV